MTMKFKEDKNEGERSCIHITPVRKTEVTGWVLLCGCCFGGFVVVVVLVVVVWL